MNYGAVIHRASENQCYAVDENVIEVKIKTGYDIEKINIYHGDPFEGGILGGNWKWGGEKLEIREVYELQYHKVWVVRLTPKYKRLKYYFELFSEGERILFFEDGFMTEEQSKLEGKSLQCFTMPWLNPIDVKTTPDWAKDTIWYQIFPDRFCRGNAENGLEVVPWASKKPSNEDVYGGDIQGILSKLDYIKSIGITGIYLNPIFKAGTTHKYDTTDYYEIDPAFGDKESFKQLVEECHKREIKVMLDGVFNHCGDDFPQWLEVLEKGRDSRYFDWFMINEWPIDKTKHHTRDNEFYSFAFTAHMPKLNTNNPEVIEYVAQVCEYWIREFDIDGWRLDVANEISHALCKEIQMRCRAVKSDIYILGEVWHDSINWLLGDEFDAVMNYPLTTAINDYWIREELNKKDFEHSINNCYQRYMHQTNAVLFNLLDSHDTDRMYSRIGKDEAVFYQQLAVLFTMAGSTSIYYGTEIMMEGTHDPDCRACMPWDEIELGKYDAYIEKMQRLTHMRNTIGACKSQVLRFENNYQDKRIIEYVKDEEVRVIVNVSDNSIEIDAKKEKVLFSNQLDDLLLHPKGVVIFRI